jgi:hypothetical protein
VLVDEPFDVAVGMGLTVRDDLPAAYPDEQQTPRRAVNPTS